MKNSRLNGQGVVEYAGALIVATLLVATVMGGGVDGLSHIFGTIISSTGQMLNGHLPS